MQRYFILISIILSCVSTITDISSSSTPTCGYCPSSYCPVKSQPCSSNSDCECLLMAMTGGGMCADTVISCQSLSPCGNDNQTCSSPDTVCVNNSRCGVPICFPISRASSDRCPSLSSRVSITTSAWCYTGVMNNPRSMHTSLVLTSGKVLVVGGFGSQNTSELYDSSLGSWMTTGRLNIGRYYQTAVVLRNGKVLVAGGYTFDSSSAINSTELYDPSTGLWTVTGSLSYARYGYTGTLLSDGKVLVTGGYGNSYLSTAETYNPSTGV
ncbi:unnamed protein product [Rotaria socialis]|uniref:Uncharacterized protein n=1 Tax=Rotaria socialis TaxID=392032 RepID=A0A817MFP3_9BILA|nr:unnamed protein product [Rotaria socialis]CAF4474119.1 unnamed protein product [Rotaria socialis]